MYQFGLIEGDEAFRRRGGLVAPMRRRAARVEDARFELTRLLDIAIALVVLVFTAPLLLALAVTINLQDGGPALFAHPRIGRGGRTFRCFKFRSMVTDAEAQLKALLETDPRARREWDADHKLRTDPRLTPIGDFLRKSSLDELPQLFNVLRGEMSIVGPRPIVQAEVVRYGPAFRHYCSLRPGITGLWQVSGRNDVSYRRRVALDRLYAGSKNLRTDLKILALTIPAVLSRHGSY